MYEHFPHSLSREQTLVICCARRDISGIWAEEIERLLKEELDWDIVIATAKRQNLLSLLYWHLQKTHNRTMPYHASQRLGRFFQQHSHRNLYLTAELLRISRLCEGEDITILAYKGPALAHQAYGSVALRPMSDLDILVRPQEVGVIQKVLLEQGYLAGHAPDENQKNVESEIASASAAKEAWTEILSYENSFVSADEQVLIELHWAITDRQFSFNMKMEEAWMNRVPSDLNPTLATLSPEDSILALCVHGAKHEWERLEWVSSLAELLYNERQPDWSLLFKSAKSLGILRILWLGVLLSRDLRSPILSEFPFSDAIGQQFKVDSATYSVRNQVWELLLDPNYKFKPHSDKTSAELLRWHSFQLNLRERKQTRIEYVRLQLKSMWLQWIQFTHYELSIQRGPRLLNAFYFLRRLARSSWRFVKSFR